MFSNSGRYAISGCTRYSTYITVSSAVSKLIYNFQTVKSKMKSNYFESTKVKNDNINLYF